MDQEFHIKTQQDMVVIPLVRQIDTQQLRTIQSKVPEARLEIDEFTTQETRRENLEHLLSSSLPVGLSSKLPRSFDIVGDIAILELADDLVPYENRIGEAIMKLQPSTKAVFRRIGAVSGVERIRPLRHIAGENRTSTVHREFGSSFKIDLSKVFFSPRLSTEHHRVASKVGKGERVLDMFAGVGPFSILIAKIATDVSIDAIDLNPEAAKLLVDNVRSNKVASKVHVHLGDARHIIRTLLMEKMDRVIMNHPSSAKEFVGSACDALHRSGGTLHYYTFSDGEDPEAKAGGEFSKAVKESGYKVDRIIETHRVREVAPLRWHVAVDATVMP